MTTERVSTKVMKEEGFCARDSSSRDAGLSREPCHCSGSGDARAGIAVVCLRPCWSQSKHCKLSLSDIFCLILFYNVLLIMFYTLIVPHYVLYVTR